jgi:predicted nucleic acid-binding OB-fold protein
MHSDTNAADNILARMSDVEITRYMKHSEVKKILLERSQKFRDSLMETEAITGKDQPQTLEPEGNFTSQVNQRANYQQLTLFDLG